MVKEQGPCRGRRCRRVAQFYKMVCQDNAADSAADDDRTPLCCGLRYLVCAMLCLELSSVCCERGFSCMNRIKCKARNRMYVETLDCLMMIELNGPAIKEKEAVHRLIDVPTSIGRVCAVATS